MDAEAIAIKEAEELLKKRRENQARLKNQEKKVDYFERAKRLEEIPLLQKSLEEKQVADKTFWEQQEKERIAALIEARTIDVATAERMVRMETHRDAFKAKLAAEREKRLADRKAQRIDQRKQKHAEKLAEKRRAEERALEEARKAKEEEEKREREERERKEKEEQEAALRERKERSQPGR